MLSQSYANNSFDQCNCTRTDGLSCKRTNDQIIKYNIEEKLNLLTSKFTELGMSLPIILTCLLGMCLIYFVGECCSSDLISMDVFILGPVPRMENDSQTSRSGAKSLLNLLSWSCQKVKNIAIFGAKSLLNFLSWSCQKVKGYSLVITICFAVSIIVMIFVTPTIFFDRLFKLDYGYCKQGTYEFNITAKDKTCEGWFEFRYLNLIKYFPIRYNIH